MMRKTNVRITGPPEGVEREKGTENIFREIVTELPKTGEGAGEVQEAKRSLCYLNAIKCSLQDILMNLLKSLKGNQAGKVTCKGISISLSDFSAKILQTRKGWNDLFEVLKNKNCLPRTLYLAKICFTYEGEIKAFPDKNWGSLAPLDLPSKKH